MALQACDIVTDKEFLEASLDKHEDVYPITVARLKPSGDAPISAPEARASPQGAGPPRRRPSAVML